MVYPELNRGHDNIPRAFILGLLLIFVFFPLLFTEVFAQNCSSPPTGSYGPAWAKAYKKWCEDDCCGVFSMSGGNPSCTPGPRWGCINPEPAHEEPTANKEKREKEARERLNQNLRDLNNKKKNQEQAVNRLKDTLKEDKQKGAINRLKDSLDKDKQKEAINRLKDALNEDRQKTAMIPIAKWLDNYWGTGEKEMIQNALSRLKDRKIRNWIATNVQFVRFKYMVPSNFPDYMSSGASLLRFKDGFFLGNTTDARRENLIAFEAGKAFYLSMKDQPAEGGKPLRTWFEDFSGLHDKVIVEMKAAKHHDANYHNEGLSFIQDYADPESRFGYIFRAQALQLDNPKSQLERQEWDEVILEFRKHVDPLLRDKQ